MHRNEGSESCCKTPKGKKLEIGSLRKPDGTYATTPQETLQLLLDTHFPEREPDDIDIDIQDHIRNFNKFDITI